MLHRGTQPTAPSRQVHWYLQLLWKDSPLRYTVPPKTQGAPSLAEGEEGKKGKCRGQASVLEPEPEARRGWELGAGLQGNSLRKGRNSSGFLFRRDGEREGRGGGSSSVPRRPGGGGGGGGAGRGARGGGRGRGLQVLPVHTPILRLAGEPKSQKRPLCGSQGSRSVHSSPSCLAHTRQQPQLSSTRLTPAGQRGAGPAAHWHRPPQSWPEAGCGGRRLSAGRTPLGAAGVPPGPPPGPGRRGGLRCLPGYRGRAGARRRSGRGPGRRRTWSGHCERRAAAGRAWRGGPGGRLEFGPEAGSGRAGLLSRELSAWAAAVGLKAVGRRRWESHWLPPLGGEELLCEARTRSPRLLYAQGGPGSPMS